MINEIEYENLFIETNRIGFRMTVKTKRMGIERLKRYMEENVLEIKCKEILEELSNFVRNGVTYKADAGYHDDIVMTLVILSAFTFTDFFVEYNESDFFKDSFKPKIEKEISEDLVLFGYSDGKEEWISDEEESDIETTISEW